MIFLLNVQLSNKLILVLDFFLNLLKEFRNLSIGLFLQEIHILILWELRGCKMIRARVGGLPARIFSTALATMKFLSETNPWIGFSSFLGTGGFLESSSL